MSNSDNTSNADKKLEALYKLTQQGHRELPEDKSAEDISPPDIDASLMAAARAATAGGSSPDTATANTDAAAETGGISWQQRYGWATAATLLLTSVLFISQLDTQPQSAAISADKDYSEHSKTLSDAAPDAAQAAGDSASAASSRSLPEAVEAVSAAEAEPQPEFGLDSISSRGFVSELSKSAPAPQAPQETAEFSKQLGRKRVGPNRSLKGTGISPATSDQIEEIAVTSRPIAQDFTQDSVALEPAALGAADGQHKSVQAHCLDYPTLLISQVCTHPLANPASINLRANSQSECAGQTLSLRNNNGLPEPDASSTLDRFVFKNENAAEPPTEEVVCQSGKLTIQSLARGR